MSHALLLRFFQSPTFFTVHVALKYLASHGNIIGISHYLTGRLREFSSDEIMDVWGFICHLLVTRPTKSCALETFVIERAEQSTHTALLTMWFMQGYLTDLSTTRRHTESFIICQRVLLKVQNIIYGDPPPPKLLPYSTLSQGSQSRFWRRRVKPKLSPALVGIGSIVASVPGMPSLASITGSWAIEQGRMGDGKSRLGPHSPHEEEYDAPMPAAAVDSPFGGDNIQDEPLDDSNDEMEELDVETFGRSSMSKMVTVGDIAGPRTPFRRSEASLHDISKQSGNPTNSPRRRPGPSQTSPSLSDAASPLQIRSSSERPRHSSSLSHVSLFPGHSASHTHSIPSTHSPDLLLQKYDTFSQSQLLRSHYLRSEVKFMLHLESIASRLLVVPKPARVSALRAELTALNHNLPAEVCFPLWCTAEDLPLAFANNTKCHHRVVRIPPGESVVLNSAERSPYLLLIEILHSDLDFDPSKRGNRELVKKIIVKEDERQSRSGSNDTARASTVERGHWIDERESTPPSARPEGIIGAAAADISDAEPPVITEIIPRSPHDAPDSDEEMDLVEQAYGSNLAVDLSDTIVLPSAPKNKALDMATWSKAASAPSPSLPTTPNLNGVSSSSAVTPITPLPPSRFGQARPISLEDYSERMRTAAVMLAQLNSSVVREPVTIISPGSPPQEEPATSWSSGALRWIPGTGYITGASTGRGRSPSNAGSSDQPSQPPVMRMKLQQAEATAIKERIMQEMLALEEERMERMRENVGNEVTMGIGEHGLDSAEDEGIVRRELNKADPSAAVFRESWTDKKARIRAGSPYGHLANWDCVSCIVKTGADLRQEQLAVQLIQVFERIWREENCGCWVRYFRILITGSDSGLVETITDAVSIHSIKKVEYAKRIAEGRFGHITLFDHFLSTYGDPSSVKFARAQRCFAKSLAGYSLVTYLLQIKDRHNGNILLDREGHVIHIDFGFLLSNSPGNMGFEAAPFKLPLEYIEVLGGLEGEAFMEFKRLFKEGFEAARKHCDSIVTLVELMQKDSSLPCFAAFGDQTAQLLRDRFQYASSTSPDEHVEYLITSSLGSAWTRLYDSYQYYSQSIL